MINKNVDRDLVESIVSVIVTGSDNSLSHLSESNVGSCINNYCSSNIHTIEDKKWQINSSSICNYDSFNAFPRLSQTSIVNDNSMLKIHVLNGRPKIDDIVQPTVVDVEKPVVFMRGSTTFLHEVKSKFRKKIWKYSIYEKKFEM